MDDRSKVVMVRRFVHPYYGWISVRWKTDGSRSVEMDEESLKELGVKADCWYQKGSYSLRINDKKDVIIQE